MGLFDSWGVEIRTELRRTVLYPGNVLEGVVHVKTSKEITYVAIRLEVAGKDIAIIRRKRRREHMHHNRTEETIIFDTGMTLLGEPKSSNSRERHKLAPGTYTYPFAVQIPAPLPPSYEYKGYHAARIEYTAKAYVDIPMGPDASHTANFSVVTAMPHQQLTQRAPLVKQETIPLRQCCCMDRGSCSIQLNLEPNIIVLQRDPLSVQIDVDNTLGKRPVKEIKVTLKGELTINSNYQTRVIKDDAAQFVLQQEVPEGQRRTVSGSWPLALPDAFPQSFRAINVSYVYHVAVKLCFSGASNVERLFPVTIVKAIDETNYAQPVVPDQPAQRFQPIEVPYNPPNN